MAIGVRATLPTELPIYKAELSALTGIKNRSRIWHSRGSSEGRKSIQTPLRSQGFSRVTPTLPPDILLA